jgi:UPF0716 protein FxsA
MGGLLLLVFIVVPILEIVVFIRAGEWIGLWPTVAGVVLTAVIGAAIVRHQGLSTLARAQRSLGAGRFPVTEVFDGLCLVIAGAFLITPGFLTDSAGFVLLVPPVRAFLRQIVGRRMIASGRVNVWAEPPPREPPPRRNRDGIVIDAEYEHVPEPPEQPPPPGERRDEPPPGERRDVGSPWRQDEGKGDGNAGGKCDDRDGGR